MRNGQGSRAKKAAAAIKDKEIQDLRQALALAGAVLGKRSGQIAEELGISQRQAQIILQEAKRSEIFQTARDWIGQKILPLALQNLEQLLLQGDKETTLKVIERMALIGSGDSKAVPTWGAPAPSAPSGATIEETFEAFRWRVSSRSADHPAAGEAGSASGTPAALEGEVVPAGETPTGED